MFKINKPNNYKNTVEALKEACDLDVSFPSNYKGIIDAIMMCREKNGNINEIIAGVGIELEPEHGDLTKSSITISASGLDLFCDDCFVYCEPRPGYGGRWRKSPKKLTGDIYVLKLSSDSCGLCFKMARYDQKVVEETGFKFIEVKKDTPNEEKFQYVIDKAFPTGDYGFPCYIVCYGETEETLEPAEIHRGAVDKGEFRRRIESIGSQLYDPAENDVDNKETENICTTCNKEDIGWYPESAWNESYGAAPPHSGTSRSCYWKRKLVDCKDYCRGKQVASSQSPNGGKYSHFEICKPGSGGDGGGDGGDGNGGDGGDNKPNPCETDRDCNEMNCMKCKDGECVNKCKDGQKCDSKGNCVECTKDDHCPKGKICKGNKCVDKPECSQNSDCPKGQICKGGSCVDKPECNKNSDCPVGEICDGGKCVDKPCSKDQDCPSGWICKNGICVEKETECSKDKDCPPGQICKDGKCKAKPPECRGDEECPGDQVCNGGNCVERPPHQPPECSNNGDCPGNEICVNGKCEPPPPLGSIPDCSNNGDCPPGQICDGGFCKETECSTNDECADGEICKNGICKPAECEKSEDCPDDKVCIDGECTNPECSEDRDCPPGENCDDGGVCTDRCEDVVCPDGQVCIEGECYYQLCIDAECDGGWIVDWSCVKAKLNAIP